MKYFIALVLALTFSLPLFAQKLTHSQDSIDTIKENLKAGKAVMVDVREPDEWDLGHLDGAIHLPTTQLENATKRAELIKKLDKNKIIYTHCKAGYRALSCAELLKAEGFDVRPLKSGYQRLIADGFEKAK
ncbi:rhodanese-like domain-containing protein [Anatilimnocola floriformis]|uniref:rhodanese-like domain-containing protein n=1 Tax=Anatilimnocola floriformis TaxID=2948575 RepID=UPI0020C487F3|nr:rhodanese-like domain-containing protein [Anatilimnocola floriformis]